MRSDCCLARLSSAEQSGEVYLPLLPPEYLCRLVPLFSDFFYAILSHYHIQSLHLQPNSVLLMAIFAFYCEAFVGVRPSVALFRHFITLWFTAQGQRSACVSFVDVGDAGTHLKAGKKVESYQNH
ncbi:hypothetical protein D1007_20789 [Hordeum vulgare]|nr:hypothetical protein D1007_20789 [Hordeum vulgare]